MANLLSCFSSVRGFHAFFIDTKKKSVRFDVVVDFAEKNLSRLRAVVVKYQVVCAAHDLAAIYSGVNFIADLLFDALSDDLIKGFFYQKHSIYDDEK